MAELVLDDHGIFLASNHQLRLDDAPRLIEVDLNQSVVVRVELVATMRMARAVPRKHHPNRRFPAFLLEVSQPPSYTPPTFLWAYEGRGPLTAAEEQRVLRRSQQQKDGETEGRKSTADPRSPLEAARSGTKPERQLSPPFPESPLAAPGQH